MSAERLALIVLSVYCVAVTGNLEIIKGNEAAEHEFPFMVGLFYGVDHECGGSLIRPNIVLTAAHCVSEDDARWYAIKVGDHVLSKLEDFEQEIRIKRIITHERYKRYEDYTPMMTNDLALLVLEEDVELRDGIIETIPLARNDIYYKEGTAVTVSGWGDDQYGNVPDVLQKLEYEVADQRACQNYWEKSNNGSDISEIFENQVCIIDPARESSAYEGDSGGPLFVKSGENFTQIGLVSWGQDYKLGISYNMFTDTYHFLDWIEDIATFEGRNKTVLDFIKITKIITKLKKIEGSDYSKGKVNCKVQEQRPGRIDFKNQVVVNLFEFRDGIMIMLNSMKHKDNWSDSSTHTYSLNIVPRNKLTKDSCFVCSAVLRDEGLTHDDSYTLAYSESCPDFLGK